MYDHLPRVLSVHTPKSGGTSISRLLQDVYGSRMRVFNADDPASPLSMRNVDPDRYFSHKRQFPVGILCIHGHLSPAGYRIDDDVILFTLLRHPVDNLISIYFFWKAMDRQGSPLHDYFLDNCLTLLETARLPMLRYLYTVSYFGGVDMRRFDIIGRHENREQALLALSDMLGAPLNINTKLNLTAIDIERAHVQSDSKMLSQLNVILADDIAFYEKYVSL